MHAVPFYIDTLYTMCSLISMFLIQKIYNLCMYVLYIRMYVCMYACMYVCMHACTYVYTYTYVRTYMRMSVCMHAKTSNLHMHVQYGSVQ